MLTAFLALSVAGAAPNRSLSVDFIRTKALKNNTETVTGTLYQSGDRIIINVTAPVAQFVVIDSASTLIYNPGERSAIQFHRRNTVVMPLFQTFLGFLQNDQIAPPPGFIMGTSERQGDSLRIRWVPEPRKTSLHGRFETIYCKDKPVRAGMYDKRGNLIYSQRFSRDLLVHGHHVPLLISSQTLQDSDTLNETVLFSNFAAEEVVPDEILRFKIPADVPIKDIEW